MAVEHPKTFYEWLLRVKYHELKCSPLEAFQDERYHHAVSRTNSNISYGFWDHRIERGFIDPENSTFRKEEAARKKAGAEWDVFTKQ